jgi:hypothetical protein
MAGDFIPAARQARERPGRSLAQSTQGSDVAGSAQAVARRESGLTHGRRPDAQSGQHWPARRLQALVTTFDDCHPTLGDGDDRFNTRCMSGLPGTFDVGPAFIGQVVSCDLSSQLLAEFQSLDRALL